MLILLFFSFLAGIVTVASPCVLPVLPLLLAAGFEGGRKRAWGIVIGFIGCFTLATLTLSQALHTLGTSGNWLHIVAVVILVFFGLTLLIPALGEWLARLVSPLAQWGEKLAPKTPTGFVGGIGLGLALGLIWTPCAGPILATLIILTTLNALSFTIIAMVAGYAIGAAIPMLAIMYGGSYIKNITSQRAWLSNGLRVVFGILTIGFAVAISMGWVDQFQQTALNYLPVIEVENNRLVKKRLSSLVKTSAGKQFTLRVEELNIPPSGELPNIAPAPDFGSDKTWFNSQPLSKENLKGKVVLVDFWTYSCINCLRTLPYLERWYDNYKDKGFVLIGVHTPEFSFEQQPENVKAAMSRYGVKYPVVLDNDYAIWRSYGNLYWPAHYLIDQNGNIRYYHFGEGKYIETENAIRHLLGLKPMMGIEEQPSRRAETPEIYIGYGRAAAYPYTLEIAKDKMKHYVLTEFPEGDHIALEGDWIVHEDRAESASSDSYIDLNFIGTKVHLVLGEKSSEPVKVMLDGKPLPRKYYSTDMNAQGEIFVTQPRKYDLILLGGNYGRHRLRIQIPKGLSAFAFTFSED